MAAANQEPRPSTVGGRSDIDGSFLKGFVGLKGCAGLKGFAGLKRFAGLPAEHFPGVSGAMAGGRIFLTGRLGVG
jgi:hypothetical protein